MSEIEKKFRPLAFYLPQYHPIKENDEWWGKGFTEWTNVTKAKPLFKGHYQPQLPSDLGFYDLRVPEVRAHQADLARQYGVHGFCYYHYWFSGTRILERPLDSVMHSGDPDLPFSLCWANENWTRNWDGDNKKILLKQDYSDEDDRRHGAWLAGVFRDERYIRVNGRPLFLVYRTSLLPNPERSASIWREVCVKEGVGNPYLCNVESFAAECRDPATIGFDASVQFMPVWGKTGTPEHRSKLWKFARKIGIAEKAWGDNQIHDYVKFAERMLSQPVPSYKRYPGITPSWDNTARRKTNAFILRNASPAHYEKWLSEIARKFKPYSEDENFIFINAWNEWAEGNHLEPCQKWGHGYLEATRRALRSYVDPLVSEKAGLIEGGEYAQG